jgi:hypothetical protein
VFDRLGGGAPFTMMAGVNFAIVLLTVAVLRRPQAVAAAR